MSDSSPSALSWAPEWLKSAAVSGNFIAEARAGKQLLDEGGASAELRVLAKKTSRDAVSADIDFVAQIEAIAALYEEAAHLLEQVQAQEDGLQSLAPAYRERAGRYRQTGQALSRIPQRPEMTSEEVHASRLLPLRAAKAQLGLGPPVAAGYSSVESSPALGGSAGSALSFMKDPLGLSKCRGKSEDTTPTIVKVEAADLDFELGASAASPGGIVASSSAALAPGAFDTVTTTTSDASSARRTRSAMPTDWDNEFFPAGTFSTDGLEGAAAAASFLAEAEDFPAPAMPAVAQAAAPKPAKEIPVYARPAAPQGPALKDLKMLSFAESVPLPRSPSIREPLSAFSLPGLTLAGVRSALLEEPFLFKTVYCEHLKAKDIEITPWETAKEARTKIRGIKLRMPVPTDLPSAMARLVSVPETSRMTSVFRLKDTEDEVVLVTRSASHDIPLGEHFRVQEILSFRSAAAKKGTCAGVSLTTWVEAQWVKAVPWGLGAIKPIFESSTLKRARQQDEALVKILERSQQRKS